MKRCTFAVIFTELNSHLLLDRLLEIWFIWKLECCNMIFEFWDRMWEKSGHYVEVGNLNILCAKVIAWHCLIMVWRLWTYFENFKLYQCCWLALPIEWYLKNLWNRCFSLMIALYCSIETENLPRRGNFAVRNCETW